MQNSKVIYSRKQADLLQSYGMEQVDVISKIPLLRGYGFSDSATACTHGFVFLLTGNEELIFEEILTDVHTDY